MLLLTDYATERAGTIHYHEPKMCTSRSSPCSSRLPDPFASTGDPLEAEFIERLSEVNEHLAKHGLPALSAGNATRGNQGLPRRTVAGESAMEGSEEHANGH